MKRLFITPLIFVCFFGMGQAVKIKSKVLDSASVIGKSIKIGDLIVAQHDFPIDLNWIDAKTSCLKLGNGWRLPNQDELNILFKNRKKIGFFQTSFYWSSVEDDEDNAWYQDFFMGNTNSNNKISKFNVRAIRNLSSMNEIVDYVTMGIGQVVDSASIIGKPIKISNFLVAQYVFPKKMEWEDAKKYCAKLGNGWRLPNKDELNTLYINRNKIGGYVFNRIFTNSYWSSTSIGDDSAWFQDFDGGIQDFGSFYGREYYVIAIKSF